MHLFKDIFFNVIFFCIMYFYFRQGHLSMVVQLMKYGADPSLIDGEGCSCIHLAAQFGHTSIVAYLIAKGQVNVLSFVLFSSSCICRISFMGLFIVKQILYITTFLD